MDLYLDYLTVEKGLALNTIEAYSRDLAALFEWAESAAGRSVLDIGEEDLRAYLAEKKQGGMSARSIARIISSIKGFYRFLTHSGHLTADPTPFLEVPRAGQPLPKDLSLEEVDRLLAQPDPGSPLGIRDKAMIEMLYATGLRVSELLGLNKIGIIETRINLTVYKFDAAGGTSLCYHEMFQAVQDRFCITVAGT